MNRGRAVSIIGVLQIDLQPGNLGWGDRLSYNFIRKRGLVGDRLNSLDLTRVFFVRQVENRIGFAGIQRLDFLL